MNHLIRLVLPKWNFFESFQEYPLLQFQLNPAEDAQTTAWLEFPEIAPRTLWNLFYNPQDSLRMIENTLIERLLIEIQENDFQLANQIDALGSFQALKRSTGQRIKSLFPNTQSFRFRVMMVSVQPQKEAWPVLLLSKVFSL